VAVKPRCYVFGGAVHPGDGTVLREFVVNWLGTEDGADEVLRRVWARFDTVSLPPWGRLPGGLRSTYRERRARVAPDSAVQRRKLRRYQRPDDRRQPPDALP